MTPGGAGFTPAGGITPGGSGPWPEEPGPGYRPHTPGPHSEKDLDPRNFRDLRKRQQEGESGDAADGGDGATSGGGDGGSAAGSGIHTPGITLPKEKCPTPETAKCKIVVWEVKIFGTWIVHLWIEITHCDGRFERFEVTNRLGDAGYISFDAAPSGQSAIIGSGVKVVCKREYDCEDDGSEPPECACVTTETALSYGAQNQYSYTGANSNTFVAQFLKHCGIKCDLPAGAIGKDHDEMHDLFDIDADLLDRWYRGRGWLPSGPTPTSPPPTPGNPNP